MNIGNARYDQTHPTMGKIFKKPDLSIGNIPVSIRTAVIGSGPAGSFFSYYLLEMAERLGVDIRVDIFESRDFSRSAPIGCNMCGGIISESLVQNLASDGINLPPSVVQRGIDSYVLHMDVGSVRINTPVQEKRIAAVTRGSGPRDIKEMRWESFDGHLQALALKKGANLIRDRVASVSLANGYPSVKTRRGKPQPYDLLSVAVGVNSQIESLFSGLDLDYQSPETTKTFICEYYFGEETAGSRLTISFRAWGGILNDIIQKFIIDPLPA